MKLNPKNLAQTLAALVRIPSPPGEEAEIAVEVAGRLEEQGLLILADVVDEVRDTIYDIAREVKEIAEEVREAERRRARRRERELEELGELEEEYEALT